MLQRVNVTYGKFPESIHGIFEIVLFEYDLLAVI